LKKLIKEFFTPFAKKHDFTFNKPLLLTRKYDNALHIINFDLTTQGFNCNIAIQPLYVPADVINLSFGNRLNHFKTHLPGVWGYVQTEQAIENDLNEVLQLLETNALPWFEDAGNPEGIVSFIQNGLANDTRLIVGFPPFLKDIYLGFSYLYLKKYELADNALKNAISLLKDDTRDWVIELKELINDIRMLANNEPNKINDKLKEYIQQTKVSLKLY